MIIADEIYQDNVYDAEFISIKKVVLEMEAPYNTVQIASVHAVSKGLLCECGLRGAFVEFCNVPEEVINVYDKSGDVLVVNVTGCIAVEVMCNPPTKEKNTPECVDLFEKETKRIYEGFKTKA